MLLSVIAGDVNTVGILVRQLTGKKTQQHIRKQRGETRPATPLLTRINLNASMEK